jgi:hypothetical protein
MLVPTQLPLASGGLTRRWASSMKVMAGLLATILASFGLGQSPQDDVPWTVATAEVNGKPLIVRYRASAPTALDLATYGTLVVISWRFDGGESGLPASDARERMDDLEDRLTERLEPRGIAFHTATVTGDGVREWQWYARSAEEMMRNVNEALLGVPAFPIEISDEPDPQWQAYRGLSSQAR